MTDLVEDLRRLAKWAQAQAPTATIWLHAIEAADRIETLEAEITRLQRELGNQPRVRMCLSGEE